MKIMQEDVQTVHVRESCRICALGVAEPRTDTNDRAYLQCARCHGSFVVFHQLPSAKVEREQYELHENDPDDARYRMFVGHLIDPLLEQLEPGMTGLDFGSGDGPAGAAMLSEAGFPVTCYDPFFRPDRRPLERRYDFIVCCEVVEHFHHPRTEFERLDGLLKPGGLLAVMTAMEYSDIEFAAWHYRRDPTHVAFYKPDTMLQLASDLGWEAMLPSRNVVLFRKPDR